MITVARAYVDRSLRLHEVPRMIEIGLQEAETVRRVPEFDFGGDRNHLINEEFRFESRIAARSVEFDWSLKTSDLPRAQKALSAIRSDVDQLLAVATQVTMAQKLDSEYWTKMARLAELEGRSDEVAKYQRLAEERVNVPRPRTSGSPSRPLVGTRLPPFRLIGIDGRAWTTADLEGKVAVLNVWATWCGPCIEELPLLQQLYDHLKDNTNVVVLALNADPNPGVVAPFVRARGFTFPVLHAGDYVNQVLPNISIPCNWIVESNVIRSEHVGLSEPGRWLQEILAKVAEVQQAK